MNYISIFILFIFSSTHVFANDFIGEFKGTEDVVIKCQNRAWNKSETRNWQTTHSDLNDKTFKILTKTGGGTYMGEAKIDGNTAIGKFTGKDGFGNSCNGEFTNTINADELRAKVSGSCPSVDCKFTSDVTAKRR